MHVQGLSRKGSETPLLHVRQAVIGVGICHRVLFQSIVLGNDVKLCMGIHHRAQEEGYNWNCFILNHFLSLQVASGKEHSAICRK